MSLIRNFVAANSSTSSSMLLATPSAHDACPAAVTGIKPMWVAGDVPRCGSRANNGKVRYCGTNTSAAL
jgi:hypothetical protein